MELSPPALIATVTDEAEAMLPWDKRACVAISCNSAAYPLKHVICVLALQELCPTQCSISTAHSVPYLTLAISQHG